MINDYCCSNCNRIFEKWSKEPTLLCPCKLKHTAEKIISGGKFSLPGIDTGFPTAADKWARRHREANHHNLKELGIPH
tara:strand:+ start:1126 stop:1359 length:234 start_codon:yes stop_codon:yes gene_type:complete